MNITITGGSGVLGRNLIERLVSNKHQVTSLDLSPMPEIENCRQIIGDIRCRSTVIQAISGADVVIHAAAALPSYSPQNIRSISVGGTKTVFDACYASRIDRVIQISSSAVYGLPEIVPTPEEHPRERVDAYNCAKIDAELICEQYREKGMCVPILRPKTFLGPHRLGIFSMLFEWAEEGHHFPLIGGGHFRSQMLDVDDLVDVVLNTMRLPDEQVNSHFNVAATEFTTLHDDFQAVLDAAGHGRRIIALPLTLTIGSLRALEMLRISPVYKRLIYKLSRDAFVSTTRAREQLDFHPRYSNHETILRTYKWWRHQNSFSDKLKQSGRTSREPWKQGALRFAKCIF